MNNKKLYSLLIALVCFCCCLLVGRSAQAAVTGSGTQADPYLVSSGSDLQTAMLTNTPAGSASAGQTVRYVTATTDLTIGTAFTLNNYVNITLDMGGHAMYFTVEQPIRLGTNTSITYQNANTDSGSATTNSLTAPAANGSGTVTAKYNTYYGIFYRSGTPSDNNSITFNNIVQNFPSITNWNGDGGQPFFNTGITVNFNGTNLFNYPNSGQEFMEGAGVNVLSGTTTITHSTSDAIINADSVTGTNSISVAAGATLNFSGTSSVYGFYYGISSQPFVITNNGTLNLTYGRSGSNSNGFYGGYTPSSITHTFGDNSVTSINAYRLYNFAATSGAFKTTIGNGAIFSHQTSDTTAFYSTVSSNDSFIINSANNVKFITGKTSTTAASILGTDTSVMPIQLNLVASDTSAIGYGINAYNSAGTSLLTSTMTSGAYGISGAFHGSLADLAGTSITGYRKPSSSEITTYQTAATLEFVKQTGSLGFLYLPDNSAMVFSYPLSSLAASGGLLARNASNPTMTFQIANTYPNSSFTVQASVSDSTLPAGLNFAWYSPTSNITLPLSSSANSIFNSNNSIVSTDGLGNYSFNYAANQGLQLQANQGNYYCGNYSATINWTLVSGIQ